MRFLSSTWLATRIAFWTVAAVSPCTDAQAQSIPGYPESWRAYDPREVALLPNYCKYTQEFRARVQGGGDLDELARWRSVMGETFEHMHHYCWGLMKTNRGQLLARDQQTRRFYIADAVGEFNYVIERAPPDFIMLPEILTKKGENLIRVGQGPLGMVELERAAELKPDYWPPYALMSDYYKDAGNVPKARDLLERGLALIPDAAALKRRLAELDPNDTPKQPAPRQAPARSTPAQ